MMAHLMDHRGSSFVTFTHTLRFSYLLVKEIMVNTTDGAKKHATILLELFDLMLLSYRECQIFLTPHGFNGL